MALLSTGLVSCNQDFETIFSPQTNPQESLLQASDVTVANNTPAVINLAEYFTEDGIAKAIPIGAATVKEGAMPANTILKAEVEFSKDADFGNSIVLDANSLDGSSDISVSASLLQDAYFNEITRNPATTDLYIRTVLYTVTGGTSDAIVGKPGENYYAESKVQFTRLLRSPSNSTTVVMMSTRILSSRLYSMLLPRVTPGLLSVTTRLATLSEPVTGPNCSVS